MQPLNLEVRMKEDHEHPERERLGAGSGERRNRRSYRTALEAFGHLRLAELEVLSLEIAEWQTTLPPRYRYAIMRSPPGAERRG